MELGGFRGIEMTKPREFLDKMAIGRRRRSEGVLAISQEPPTSEQIRNEPGFPHRTPPCDRPHSAPATCIPCFSAIRLDDG